MENNILDKAFEFAKNKHGKQMYGNEPYTYHLLDVLQKVEQMGLPLEYQVVALLHDTLEDTDATWDEICSVFGLEVAKAVVILSKDNDESYEEYLGMLKYNKISLRVKICDILCNLKQSYKMENCKRKELLIQKYEKALFILGSGD